MAKAIGICMCACSVVGRRRHASHYIGRDIGSWMWGWIGVGWDQLIGSVLCYFEREIGDGLDKEVCMICLHMTTGMSTVVLYW